MPSLILRFDAPLMSFGGVLVDHHNPTERFPSQSQMTGLLANAMGWEHGDVAALEALQSRVMFAARWDVPPEPLVDYHTVDLGQSHLVRPGWTTHGVPEHRAGGDAARKGTHQRYRHYWANGVLTLALTVSPDAEPELDTVGAALCRPVRPLFLGRKTCIPSAPVFRGRRDTDDVLGALSSYPADPRAPGGQDGMEACWPADLERSNETEMWTWDRADQRDWRNQMHTGRRFVTEGRLREIPPCT